MVDFCVQVQPHRSPALDMAAVASACEEIARDPLVSRFQTNRGNDRVAYVNFMFATDDARGLWRMLRDRLYGDSGFGPELAAASMTMCEGEDGWNDYLLLAHFDPAQRVDAFPAD